MIWSSSSSSSQVASSDRLLAGVDENEGAVESACNVLGEDSMEENSELLGETIVPKPVLLFDLEGVCGYEDCGTNFGCE
jgi:hypothetical protein